MPTIVVILGRVNTAMAMDQPADRLPRVQPAATWGAPQRRPADNPEPSTDGIGAGLPPSRAGAATQDDATLIGALKVRPPPAAFDGWLCST